MMRANTLVPTLLTLARVAGPAAAFAQAGPDPVPPVATGRFELRSDPWVGLHHFLLDWAAAEADRWPPFAPPIVERDAGLDALSTADREAWQGAVEAYGATVGRSLLFDEGLLALRDWAAGVGTRDAIPEGDRPLATALEAALPVYERHWWATHDARNRAWIDAMTPVLPDVEDGIAVRLEAAYGGEWPEARIPADVVAYANPVGAYSTAGRVTIASGDRDNTMPQAVELLFHEASHVDPLERTLRAAVEAAFERAGGKAPDRFWHDVIFVTSGEITRLIMAASGRRGYRHYGEVSGLYARGARWAIQLPAFETHWLPFVRSGSADPTARAAALEALAVALLGDPRRGHR